MEPGYAWVYLLVFLALPLSRIIPRLIARARAGSTLGTGGDGAPARGPGRHEPAPGPDPQEPAPRPDPNARAPPVEDTDERRVLGAMHRGANTFEKIRGATGLEAGRLEATLGGLEDGGLVRVVRKQGLLGGRIELYSTDAGFRSYYS